MIMLDVRALLLPANPDTLQPIAPGVWTARWARRVTLLERIVVDTHDGIEVVQNWYTPARLKGWTAIDFRTLE